MSGSPRLEARLQAWGFLGFAVMAAALTTAMGLMMLVWWGQARAVNREIENTTRIEALVLGRLLIYDLASDPRVAEVHRLEALLSDLPPRAEGVGADARLASLVAENLDWPDTEIWRRAVALGLAVRVEEVSAARRAVYRDMLQSRLDGIREDLWARITFSDNLRGVTLLSARGTTLEVGEPIPGVLLDEPSKATREVGADRLVVTLPLTTQSSRWGTAYLLLDRSVLTRLSSSLHRTLRLGLWALAGLLILLACAWGTWWTLLLKRVRSEVVSPIVHLAQRMESEAGGRAPSPPQTGEALWLSGAFDRLMERLAAQQEQLLRAQKLGLMERVGAGLSHEINNALNPARLRLDALAMEGKAADAEDVAVLRGYLSHAQRVLKDLTFAVRRPSGPLGLLPPAEWLSVARRLVEPSFHDGVELVWEAGEEAPLVYGEAQWLVQVAVNLLLNARDAAGERDRGGQVRVTLTAEGEETAVLRIEDDGAGIPAEVEGQIFEPFVTSKPKGSGLGLFVVDQFVRRMGGRVALLPREGGGTAAEVRLRRKVPEGEVSLGKR